MAIYLQLGNIKGGVTQKGHENWMKLTSFDFDAQRNVTVRPGHVSNRAS